MKKTLCLASLLSSFSLSAAAEKIVVYNWSEYVPEGAIEEFTQQTGIDVEYMTYESNEVMHSKLLLQKGKGYDIIVPSTYYISKMRQEGLLQKIPEKRKFQKAVAVSTGIRGLTSGVRPAKRFYYKLLERSGDINGIMGNIQFPANKGGVNPGFLTLIA